MPPSHLPFDNRVHCPCCGYPTLTEARAYEICELCNWEDDGQGDADAHIVRGGPNGNYSLADARSHFQRYLVMYRPDYDTRVGGPDTAAELTAKRHLIAALDELRDAGPVEGAALAARAREQEAILEAELHRRIRVYEGRPREGGSA